MKFFLIFFLCFITNSFFVCAQEKEIDRIAAIVNNEIILNSDINKVLFLLKKESRSVNIPLKTNFFKNKILNKLIIDAVVLEEAKKINILTTKKQVDNMIQNIAAQKNMTLQEFKNNVFFNQKNSYFTYNDYFEYIKKLIKIKTIENYEMYHHIKISDQEVNDFLNKTLKNSKSCKKVKLSYVLLPLLSSDSEKEIKNKKILSKNIITKLKNGYSVKNLYYQCKKNKNICLVNKIPWTKIIDVQNVFFNHLKIIKKNQVLGPFLEHKGFYILKINNIKNCHQSISKEFHIQHCLIKKSPILSNQEAKKNIFKIYENIKRKIYSFDYAVKNFSEDFYSFRKNGDLGWLSEKLFSWKFNHILKNLKQNEISQPISSSIGWHIIKLIDKREVNEYLKFQKNKVYRILFNQKIKLKKYHWLKNLKKSTYIKVIKN